MNTHHPLLPGGRDPERLLREAVDDWDGGDAWIFGYASLIWRPEFDSAEDRPATVYGWHRSLAMRSRVNRGTPECPGLVFALAFTLDRKSPSHTGRVADEQMVEILRTANGRFGSTLAYLVETATSLRNCGIRDRDIERLV